MTWREVKLPQPVLFVLGKLRAAGFETYLVGGAVRDLLLDRPTHDWDLTTNATPEAIQASLVGTFYDNAYGTVGLPWLALAEMMEKAGWQVDEATSNEFASQVLEITTYRADFNYTDRRRPERVEWGQSLEADLARRDFTINAIAMSVRPEELEAIRAFAQKTPVQTVRVVVTDPYGGEADLGARVIRAVGEPEARFEEDALRMLRAIRIGAQLGFGLDLKTLTAIQAKAPLIKQIAWERIAQEGLKLLSSAYPAEGMRLLENAGLLKFILPELSAMRGVKQGGHHRLDVWDHSLQALKDCPSSDPIVRLATLLHDVGKPVTYREQGPRGVTFYNHEVVGARMAREIGRRWRLPAKEVERLFILVRWHMFTYNPEMTDAAIRRLIRRVGKENINDLMLLRVGDRKGGGRQATSWRLRELQERIGAQFYAPLSLRDMAIGGKEVMAELQIPPGPEVGRILNLLFEEVLEDSSKNNRDYLLARTKILSQSKRSGAATKGLE